MTWTDTHEGSEHAYTVALDDALRPVGEPIDVTPEGGSVKLPVLRAFGDKLVLVYGDGHGTNVGVHARMLDAQGRFGGPLIQLGPLRGPTSGMSIDRAEDGTFWLAWEAEVDSGNDELFLRHFSDKLDPLGEPVRATDFVAQGPQKPRVRSPMLAITGDSLQVAYRLERTPQQTVYRMRVPLADAGKPVEARKKGDRADRFIGESFVMNKDKSKADATSIACTKDACFLAWDGEGSTGVSVAYLEPKSAAPIWTNDKKFSRAGGHPAVGLDASGNARIIWFEKGGIMTAAISRDGIGPATKIARVSGVQPPPAIIAGKAPGEWLMAWLDFEAGQLEPYAARFVCK
jgi:serine/threonine-protein kinase